MMPAVVIPVVIALIGIAGAYWNNIRSEHRKAQISLVNDQLKYLYGPLFALSHASRSAWIAFRSRYRPDSAYFDVNSMPDQGEVEAWRRWMTVVFAPINEKMVGAILDHADLILGTLMPPSFIDLIAHVEGYRVVLSRWADGDFSDHVSLLNFPTQFEEDVRAAYDLLKQRQASLTERDFATR